ncbi:MAG: hypothetical protein HC800_13390 [Phormidesmis sp. RL_2_1]|nr:hypothetical protein [Phormidesmis sp. RL_2_1]
MNLLNSQYNSKRLALSAGMTVATMWLLASSAEAASFNLDFDARPDGSALLYNSDGTLQGDQWAEWGVTIGAKKKNSNNVAKLNTYDTDSRNGRDDDLETGSEHGTVSQGNVLIIQEESNLGSYNSHTNFFTADDEAAGGSIFSTSTLKLLSTDSLFWILTTMVAVFE